MNMNLRLGIGMFFFIAASVWLYWCAPHTRDAHCDLDSYAYDRIATHFATYGTLTDPHSVSLMPIQTVGYPLFVGTIYRIFGTHYVWVIIIQIICALLIAWYTAGIATVLFGPQYSTIAGVLTCLSSGLLFFAQFLMTDVLLALFLVAGIYYFLLFQQINSWRDLAHAGFILGCSVAIKPVALLYVFVLYGFLSLDTRLRMSGYSTRHASTGRHPVRRSSPSGSTDRAKTDRDERSKIDRVRRIFVFAACFYMPVLAYMTYNYTVFDQWVVSPVAHENIYVYYLSKVHAAVRNKTYPAAMHDIRSLITTADPNDPTRWHASHALLIHYLKTYPLKAISVWLFEVSKTVAAPFINQGKILFMPATKRNNNSFWDIGAGRSIGQRLMHYIGYGTLSMNQTIFLGLVLFLHVLFMLGAVSGFVFILIQKKYTQAFFIGITIAYFALITGHDGCARYRLMFESMYILLITFVLYELFSFIGESSIEKGDFLCKKPNYWSSFRHTMKRIMFAFSTKK